MRNIRKAAGGRLVPVVVVALFLLGLCVWLVSERAGRNDHLQREAKFLSGSLARWKKGDTNTPSILPSYTVNNREGTVVLINEEIIAEGEKYFVEFGWTNSCLGEGTLMATSNDVFFWRESTGETRKLNIPDFGHIPYWWYITKP